uniref:Uncharacterized protein n=1 Tax=viral metagenome TaxID=1070528 RepID=A0A6C0D9P1_9ZZZZ
MIVLILFCIILYLLYLNFSESENESNIKNPIEKPNFSIANKKDFIVEYDINPQFRGLSKYYNLNERNEIGGSKPFSKIKLNNDNLKNNKINFNNYSSYRLKPTTADKLTFCKSK